MAGWQKSMTLIVANKKTNKQTNNKFDLVIRFWVSGLKSDYRLLKLKKGNDGILAASKKKL